MLAQMIGCVVAGAIASLAYFGGLWWTVNQLANSQHPMAMYLVSFALRVSAIVAGAFVVLQLGWQAMFASLAGFLVVRYVMTFTLGVRTPRAIAPRAENQT